jgi:hypothetical protein
VSGGVAAVRSAGRAPRSARQLEHDLPAFVGGHASLKGARGVLEREHGVDGRGRPVAVEQPRDLRQPLAVWLDHEVDAAHTRRLRRLLGHRDEPTTLAQHTGGAEQPLAAGGVEDEVDRFDARVPWAGGVVDDDVTPSRIACARRRAYYPVLNEPDESV